MRRVIVTLLVAAIAIGASAGCSSQRQRDAGQSRQNVDRLIAQQPVEAGTWSPTREQIANWTRTWQSGPGKLAYVYLFNQGQNEPIGYYVLIGPPVSYAASAVEPYSGATANAGQDGAFYSTGTGTTQFYGKDATTGRQLEWGGTGVWYLLSDRPLRLQAPPLGDTTIE